MRLDSPIEVILFRALSNNYDINRMGLRIFTQVPILNGKYRLDLLVTDMYNNPMCVVECDGKYFHSSPLQKLNDRKRTRDIERELGLRVLRFSGTQIYNNVDECVVSVLNYVMYRVMPPSYLASHNKFINRYVNRLRRYMR